MIGAHRRTEHEFGMPLDAEDVARTAPADRLDDVVGNRVRLDLESAAELVDRLMMDRIDGRLGAFRKQLRKSRARHEAHLVKRLLVALGLAMDERLGHCGPDVLMQRAAERDVDQLTPATDAEHGLLLADERLE